MSIDNRVIILGAMKCGTTSLFNYLAAHPAISPCSVKEPNFFSEQKEWRRGRAYYEGLWNWDEGRHVYALEASVSYTKLHVYPDAPRRMKEFGGNYRFIYVVRDPFARIESHYTHGIAEGWSIASRREFVDRHAMETTKYHAQLKPYVDLFGKDSVLVLDFQMLNEDPQRLLKKVCRFLGIADMPPSDALATRYNQGKDRRAFGRLGRLLLLAGKAARAAGVKVPVSLKKRCRQSFSRPVRRYRLSEEQKKYIAAALRDDIRMLREWGFTRIEHWEIFRNYLRKTTSPGARVRRDECPPDERAGKAAQPWK